MRALHIFLRRQQAPDIPYFSGLIYSVHEAEHRSAAIQEFRVPPPMRPQRKHFEGLLEEIGVRDVPSPLPLGVPSVFKPIESCLLSDGHQAADQRLRNRQDTVQFLCRNPVHVVCVQGTHHCVIEQLAVCHRR